MQPSEGNTNLTERLKEIKRKFSLLVQKQEELKAQVEFLQKENKSLRNLSEVQKNTIKDIEEKNKISKLAGIIASDELEAKKLKIKINEYIRDIDNCIKLLNE